MSLFEKIIGFLRKEDVTAKTTIQDILNIDAKDNSKVDVNNVAIGNTITNIVNVDKIYYSDEKVIADNTYVKLRVEEIHNLISKAQSLEALKELQELQYSIVASGEKLTVNDRFLILNSMYTCYLNLYGYEKEIENLEKAIKKELYTAGEYYKFKYLSAIKLFKKDSDSRIIDLCDEILEIKDDYYKAMVLKLLVLAYNKVIPYNEAIREIQDIQHTYELSGNELAHIFISKGDIALNAKQFNEALGYYQIAYDKLPVLHYKLGIALCYFNKAIREAGPTGFISFTKIDFDALHEARLLFDEIYKEASENKDNSVLRSMLPYYLNCLEFTEESEQIIDIRRKTPDLFDFSSREMSIVTAHAELVTVGISEETTKALNETDKLKINLKQLALKGHYEEVNKLLSPLMDTIFEEDESMITMYLISLFRTKNKSFITEFKRYKDKNEEDLKYDLIWVQYLEYSSDIEYAKKYVGNLVEKNPIPLVIYDAYKFYLRNSFMDDAFDLFTKVINNEYKVRSVDLPEIRKNYFFILIDKKLYTEAENFFNSMDFSIFKPNDKLQIEVEYARILGKIDVLADKMLDYSKATNNVKLKIRSASYYMVANQIPKSLRILEDIRDNNNYEKSDLYMMLTKVYLLIGDNDKAYDSALKAKDIDKDLYKSTSHRFYVTTSMRTNRFDDSVKHMMEYHEKFPKETWVKSVRVIKEDKDGNEVLDLEAFNELLGDRTGYNMVRKMFFNYQLGISSYMHLIKDTNVDYIFAELRHKKKLIKICNGYLKETEKNTEIIKNRVIVDILTLYVLCDAEILELLDEFSEVLVSYSSMEFLEFLIINNESEILRNVMSYISNTLNVKLVPIKQALMKESKGFLDETMHCIMYSKENNIPYVTIDFNIKNILRDESKHVVDIPSVIKAISNIDEESSLKCTKFSYALMKKDYTFISFNLKNLLDIFNELEDYEDIESVFSVYLSMSRFSDYPTFVNIYFWFINIIEFELDDDTYLKFVNMIFDYFDYYVGRTRYYYYELRKLLNKYGIKASYLNDKQLTSGIFAFSKEVERHKKNINLYKIISNDYSYEIISNDNNYKKIIKICSTIMAGIYLFLLKYENNDEKLEFYYNHFLNRFQYIDGLSLNKVIDRIKEKC